jgi:hypothetical protein
VVNSVVETPCNVCAVIYKVETEHLSLLEEMHLLQYVTR